MVCTLKDGEVILEQLYTLFVLGFACEDGVYFTWSDEVSYKRAKDEGVRRTYFAIDGDSDR